MALLFTINSLDLILLQYKRSNWKEKIKIGGIYYFLPIQTVLRQYVTKLKRIRRKGKHARKYNNNNNNNNKTESNPSSNSNSNEKAKKETNQDKTPTDPSFYECSCRVDYEKSAIKRPNRMRFGFYLLKCFKIASTIRSDARPSPYGLDAFDILS